MHGDISSIEGVTASIGQLSRSSTFAGRTASEKRRTLEPLADIYGRSQSGLPVVWREDGPEIVQMARPSLQFAIKRAFDVLFALTALVILAPLMLFVAIAVRLDGGPALSWQSRVGLDGKPFKIVKFRTMRIGAGDETGVAKTLQDDDRVTPIGGLIRKTSISELPQLFNILSGDMSVVGPRPHVDGMLAGGQRYDELVEFYAYRHHVKPGLTGWAQCNGFRGPTREAGSARRRIAHDVAYIQNFSLRLDLKCIGLALKNEFIGGSGL